MAKPPPERDLLKLIQFEQGLRRYVEKKLAVTWKELERIERQIEAENDARH